MLAALIVVVGAIAIIAWRQAPVAAAYALLKPVRHLPPPTPPTGCAAAAFNGEQIVLKGWRCDAVGADSKATIVLLHGIADNRGSWRGAIARFTRQGFDVVAYDGRAHGESEGDWCTYGYLEKRDLRRVLDVLGPKPVVLVGTSLGAAIALQAAADEPRVAGVVGAETFSDLRTTAVERAPFFLTPGIIRRAFAIAEQLGALNLDAVSPVQAAPHVRAPVLLIHGAADVDTPPDHSRRVYAALGGPKRLLIVPGAGHNHSLGSEDTWREIDGWIGTAVGRQAEASESAPTRPLK